MSTMHDVLILGGGPAGQAAALVAGRARLSTVMLDAGAPRNAVTHASHGFLSRDGIAPLELRRIALEQLQTYPSAQVEQVRATSVQRIDGGFEVQAEGQSWRARRLVVATGYRDELDQAGIPDLAAVYGTSVFPCPFCDGFEHGDQRLALFGAEVSLHMGPMLHIWSNDVVVFTNGAPLAPETRAVLESGGIPVEDRPIVRLHHLEGVLKAVEVEGGDRIERDAGFLAEDIAVPATRFAEALGVGTTENDWGMTVLDVNEHGAASVPGIYVIGDARSGFGGVTAAAHQGHSCMAHIVHEIATERWQP